MTRDDLLAQLLAERFGPRRQLVKERPGGTPDIIRRRQRILLGDQEENEDK